MGLTLRYLNYSDLTKRLKALACDHPDLVRLDTLGQSFEGREIWLITLTRFATGKAEDKPAVMVDGNIHAVEYASSVIALHHVERLIADYGHDDQVTRCLDTRAFYIVPRVSPDGAELALGPQPRIVRSNTRPSFHSGDDRARMVACDVDGDGRLLMMRIPDPNGRWMAHPQDRRVMVRRGAFDEGGDYYRLLPEGRVEGETHPLIPQVRPREAVDLNRNWPSNWIGDHGQSGAGRYPLSEPETRALAHFASEHPNIFTWIAGHTFSGVLLRPSFSGGDETLPANDLRCYREMGDLGASLTGCRAVSAFSGFRYGNGDQIRGSIDWAYEIFGIYTWVAEYWAPHREAGIEVDDPAGWLWDHPADDDLKLAQWADARSDTVGYVDWYPFDHPELGLVELGGLDLIRTIYNPPESLLPKAATGFSEWFVSMAMMSPKLRFRSVTTERLAENLWRVRAVIQNVGYLPTWCSQQARATRSVRGVNVTLVADDRLTVLSPATVNIGELEGRAFGASNVVIGFVADAMEDCGFADWIVRGRAGDDVQLLARHDRSGVDEQDVVLGT